MVSVHIWQLAKWLMNGACAWDLGTSSNQHVRQYRPSSSSVCGKRPAPVTRCRALEPHVLNPEGPTGGTGAGFGEHQLVKRMREAQQKRESWVDCARGDTLKILEFADMVEAAFAQSDARWHESLKGYLGSSAVVEQADAASVRVRHADGQTLWWPYGAVKVVSRQPGTHSRQVLSVVTAYRKHAGR